MTPSTSKQIAAICGGLPADARLVLADVFRHEDFDPATAGVLLEFSTGHLHQFVVPAAPEECLQGVGEEIKFLVAMTQAARRRIVEVPHAA